jgi:hypothetical protein
MENRLLAIQASSRLSPPGLALADRTISAAIAVYARRNAGRQRDSDYQCLYSHLRRAVSRARLL